MDERIMTDFDDIVCVHTVHGHIYIYVGYMVLGRETPTTWLPGYIYILSAIIIGCVINE